MNSVIIRIIPAGSVRFSTSPTTLVFPVEDLGGLQLQGKALHGPLEQQPIFSKSAAARRGMRCALLACRVPVELVSPSWSNKLVEDLAGRLRPTAAARMNGNSLPSLTSGVAKMLAAVEHQRAGGPAADMEDAP